MIIKEIIGVKLKACLFLKRMDNILLSNKFRKVLKRILTLGYLVFLLLKTPSMANAVTLNAIKELDRIQKMKVPEERKI